jgi:hypothetical protein
LLRLVFQIWPNFWSCIRTVQLLLLAEKIPFDLDLHKKRSRDEPFDSTTGKVGENVVAYNHGEESILEDRAKR